MTKSNLDLARECGAYIYRAGTDVVFVFDTHDQLDAFAELIRAEAAQPANHFAGAGKPMPDELAAPAPPFGSKRAAALALYTPPFSFKRGYIFDANHMMLSDDCGVPEHVAQRVRGWGRIGYMPDAAALQDEVGAAIAEALTQFWNDATPKEPS